MYSEICNEGDYNTQKNAVVLTHETPVVPLLGWEHTDACRPFLESVWKLFQIEIHPEIRRFSYLTFSNKFLVFRTYGGNANKRFARGKAIKLPESDKEKIRAAVERLYRIRKSEDEHINRYAHYSKILTEILKMDNVRLAFQDNKPVIQINFENDMVVFIYQNGCIEHELRRAIKTPSEADKYIADWGAKLSEITPQIMKIKSEVPPEFYERGKS